MRKILVLFLITTLLCSCVDKSIEVKQSAGSSRTEDYGKYVLSLETTTLNIVEEKFIKREDLKGTVVDEWFNNKITIPAYFYIIRVSDSKNNKFIDIYVPKDFFDLWNVGDTIRQGR